MKVFDSWLTWSVSPSVCCSGVASVSGFILLFYKSLTFMHIEKLIKSKIEPLCTSCTTFETFKELISLSFYRQNIEQTYRFSPMAVNGGLWRKIPFYLQGCQRGVFPLVRYNSQVDTTVLIIENIGFYNNNNYCLLV